MTQGACGGEDADGGEQEDGSPAEDSMDDGGKVGAILRSLQHVVVNDPLFLHHPKILQG